MCLCQLCVSFWGLLSLLIDSQSKKRGQSPLSLLIDSISKKGTVPFFDRAIKRERGRSSFSRLCSVSVLSLPSMLRVMNIFTWLETKS